MPKPVYLHALRTLVPAHAMSQESLKTFMKNRLDPGESRHAFLDRIYDHSGIDCRHTVLEDLAFLADRDPGTAERNRIYSRNAEAAGVSVARSLFSPPADEGVRVQAADGSAWKSGPAMGMSPVHADAVTHLVTVSCTGFSAPGFDIAIQKELMLDRNLKRSHLGFMGCCAAFPALRSARDICLADPKAVVLVVLVEFCTLHFSPSLDKDTLVANSLFADGGAAFLVSGRKPGGDAWSLDAFSTTLLEDSGSEMAWTLGDKGFSMKLSAYVPRIVGSNIQEVLAGIQEGLAGSRKVRPGAHAIHPGGRAILEKVEASLGLEVCETCPDGSRDRGLAASRRILRDYGNMSAVTMAFVLGELSRQLGGNPATRPEVTRVFAAGFGPGLTVEAGILGFHPRHRLRGFRQRHGVEVPGLPLFPVLDVRLNRLELMDVPEVDRVSLDRTFRQFGLLNRLFSGYRRILKVQVLKHISRHQEKSGTRRTWRILDVGCGGGDILVWLAGEGRRRGLDLELTGLDPDPQALAMAGMLCAPWPEIRLVAGGFRDWPESEKVDFVLSNHMIHHLDYPTAREFLDFAAARSLTGPVVVDIRRSRLAYWGYALLSRLVSPGALAPYDGSLSVLRSFSAGELSALAGSTRAGDRLRVRRHWPFRLVVQASPTGAG